MEFICVSGSLCSSEFHLKFIIFYILHCRNFDFTRMLACKDSVLVAFIITKQLPVQVGMHDEIFHFEIFQDPFFEMFHEIFNFHYKVT